jgi:hypothetical protein
MATNSKLSNVAAAACAGDGTNKGLLPLLANGKLRIYSGTQPTNPDTAYNEHADEVLLAEITLPSPAGTESNGVITLGTVASVSVTTGGTAAWFRILESDGTTALWDGSVGTATADLVFSGGVVFLLGGTISGLTGGTLTIPAH